MKSGRSTIRYISEYEECAQLQQLQLRRRTSSLCLQQLRADIITLCDMFGIAQPSDSSWYYDFVNKYNDVYVDMR